MYGYSVKLIASEHWKEGQRGRICSLLPTPDWFEMSHQHAVFFYIGGKIWDLAKIACKACLLTIIMEIII